VTPPHTRRSKRVSPGQAKKRSDSRTPRNQHVAVRGAAAAALAERKDASIAPVQTRADVERLMGQLREANERLIVAAVRAQDLSDEAHVEAAQAKTELDDLIRRCETRMNA
jgi:hypothetical protein